MTTETKLADCPFCGGSDIRFDEHGRSKNMLHYGEAIWSMCCYNCGATFPNMYSVEKLREKWNQRTAKSYADGLENAVKCQPCTAEDPNEDDYQRGRFDGIMEYAAAIRALAKGEE